MADYLFRLVNREEPGKVSAEAREQLMSRPCVDVDSSLNATAELYCADQALEDAINTAIAVGEPLLLTGETGTGKTQAAYYVAWKLDIKLFHFQVKSSTTAGDLLYRFDTVRYFHDSHLVQSEGGQPRAQLNKWDYIVKAELWEAFEWGSANGCPAVLLIDEIDKAPRDFPNDLLHELSEMEFTVPELDNHTETCERDFRPLLFITEELTSRGWLGSSAASS